MYFCDCGFVIGSSNISHTLLSLLFFKSFVYLFIYFRLRWVFVAVCGLSLVAASGGYSSLWASHCGGFSCCGARALGARASVVVARGL